MVCIASFHWLAVRHGAWEELNGAQWEGGRKKAEQSYDDRTAPHRRRISSTSSISGIAGGRLVADGPWLRLLAVNCDGPQPGQICHYDVAVIRSCGRV
jgi:hypothetical protein